MSEPTQTQTEDPKVLSIPELVEIRNKYAQGVKSLDQEIAALDARRQKLEADRVATNGAVQAIESLIQAHTPKDAPDSNPKK